MSGFDGGVAPQDGEPDGASGPCRHGGGVGASGFDSGVAQQDGEPDGASGGCRNGGGVGASGFDSGVAAQDGQPDGASGGGVGASRFSVGGDCDVGVATQNGTPNGASGGTRNVGGCNVGTRTGTPDGDTGVGIGGLHDGLGGDCHVGTQNGTPDGDTGVGSDCNVGGDCNNVGTRNDGDTGVGIGGLHDGASCFSLGGACPVGAQNGTPDGDTGVGIGGLHDGRPDGGNVSTSASCCNGGVGGVGRNRLSGPPSSWPVNVLNKLGLLGRAHTNPELLQGNPRAAPEQP